MSNNPSTTKHPSHRIIAFGLILGNNSVVRSNQSYVGVGNGTYVWNTSSLQGALVTTDTHFFVPRREPPWPDHPWTSVQLIGLTCQQTDRLVPGNSHTHGQTNTPTVTNSRHQSCLMLQDIQVISLSDAHTFLTKNNKYSMMTN